VETLLEHYDQRTAIWQTVLRSEVVLPPLPLDVAVKAAATDLSAQFKGTLETYAFSYRHQIFMASPAWYTAGGISHAVVDMHTASVYVCVCV
jgi:hypothetical protein